MYSTFTDLVRALPPEDMHRPSVSKNDWDDTSSWNLLRQDQLFIMELLDNAIKKETHGKAYRILVTLTKFGQKDERALNLHHLANLPRVAKGLGTCGC